MLPDAYHWFCLASFFKNIRYEIEDTRDLLQDAEGDDDGSPDDGSDDSWGGSDMSEDGMEIGMH